VSDLVTELLLTLELALAHGRDEPALHQQLERVERAMADAVDAVFDPSLEEK
jgi:hypothetical protein